MTETAHTTRPTRTLITSVAPSLKVNTFSIRDGPGWLLVTSVVISSVAVCSLNSDVSQQSRIVCFFFWLIVTISAEEVQVNFLNVSFCPKSSSTLSLSMPLSVRLQLVLFTNNMKVVNNGNVCVTQLENLLQEVEPAVSSTSDVC